MRELAILPAIAFLAIAFGSSSPLLAQTSNWSLTLEVAPQGLTNWQTIPVTAGTIRNGKINLSTVSGSAFWRVRIAPEAATMVTVQGGSLPTNTSRPESVTVQSFRIGKYEVTVDEWLDVIAWAATNGYSFSDGPAGSASAHPVRSVSWYNAAKWCNAKSQKENLVPVYEAGGQAYKTGDIDPTINRSANGYRLPTEAEWEWAARGGVLSQGFTFAGGNDLNLVGWHRLNSAGAIVNLDQGRGTWPVAQKTANELGIHDMSGNVWEWCEDIVRDIDEADGVEKNFRRIRGGSWNNSTNSGHELSHRSRYELPGSYPTIFGFRLARNAGP